MKLFALSVFVCAGCTIKSMPAPTPEAQHYMSVTGTAQMKVDPDEMDLALTVTADRRKPKDASAQLDTKRKQLRDALAAAGIPAKRIALSEVNLRPQYHPYPRSDKLKGYRASASVMVTLTDFSQSGPVVQLAAESGVTEISSRFRSTKLPDLKIKVRDMASEAAKNKARQLVGNFGTKTGGVVSIAENAGGGALSYYRFGNNSMWNQIAAQQAGPIRGTTQTISMSITVRYKLLTS